MPPRLSQGAEAARAAAAQAEFNEKRWVWVPDERDGYLAGWVNKEEGDVGEVILAAGGEFRNVPLYMLNRMNPPKFDRVEDIAALTFLNEASVVHNLRLRYGSGAIYTYSGLFLVAINPYQALPLYSDAIIQQYRSKRRDENPPHIFAVAERAWVNMGDERENQSILITGESGAGKTESTKKVIQYLAAIATDTHAPSPPSHSRSPTITSSNSFTQMPAIGLPRSSSFKRGHGYSQSMAGSTSHLTSKGRLGLLERQILQANPILEAFGNAQTQRNNNSSRFGKFVRITFSPDGSIAGANIDWYLLEKSRVVVRSEAERSFHVFYQLLAGGGAPLKDKLLLDGSVEDYEYLNRSRREVDGVDDVEEWQILKAALDVVGFSTTEQFNLFRVVAAILHLGNIEITSTRDGIAVMPDPSQAERACHLLGIPVAEFTRAVLRPRMLAGREWVTQARTGQQALDELAALCKTLYEKCFGTLVDRINEALDRPSSKSTFIGVLDIAGFEIFEINTYEQLLINYTNEKLQQFFNHHMFVLEQEEYTREGINWDYVNFGLDLQPTIDLIESSSGNQIGILSCLDEECIMPKATDRTFTNKLNALWPSTGAPEDKYVPSRFEQGFVVRHYAADVEYRTEGWLEKNKDPLNDNLTRTMAASTERSVAALFADFAEVPGPGGPNNIFTVGKKRGLKKGAFRTVAQRHKEQLSSLMAQLQATQPHFVRCIVPNGHKKPGRIDVPLVLDQLRCNGVLEGIRIARLGYPNRLPFVEFRQRYEVLTPGIIPRGYMDGREACRRMVNTLELDDALFKIGTSKIFFKAGVLADLEERRDLLLYDIFSKLQAVARRFTARRQIKKILNRSIAIRTIQRNARVYGELRDWPWWQLYTKIRPLLAATRNDEELRKKETELALAQERAERDKLERETLKNLKMTLEAEKRKVMEELEAERGLTLDKDALLERSKKKEVELEELVAELQLEVENLDSQLSRAMNLHKESEEKRSDLRQMFDEAAEHLIRLEGDQKDWSSRESALVAQLDAANEEAEAMRSDLDQLQKLSEDLKNLALQREEDLARAKERSEAALMEMKGKLEIELQNKDITKGRTDQLEDETRHAKEQLAELTRTTEEYSHMIQKKEERISTLIAELDTFKWEREQATKEVLALQSDIDTLSAELDAERTSRVQSTQAQQKLREELDELRTLMAAKTSEETRRDEAEKSREEELSSLRAQTQQLQKDLADARSNAIESQNKLKLELENASREVALLQADHLSLVQREQSAQADLVALKSTLSEQEKTRRSVESELQQVRTRTHDLDSQLDTIKKGKEALERQLTSAQTKYHGMEDVMLELEREKSAHERQLDTTHKSLEEELAKRAKLEKAVSSHKTESARLKDANTKLDRELNKALTDLKNREWEVKQLESRQDKTIVEHVHVLEEAKRVTDRQLADAQIELEKQAAYIRSLQHAKAALTRETEDLNRETERERMELRTKEKTAKAQEEKAARALADVDKECKAKEIAELQTRRLQIELQNVKRQAEETHQNFVAAVRAKDNLETELERLADETVLPNSMARVQREYETRIAKLEEQLAESESSKTLASKLRDRVDRQHAEIRQLVMSGGPSVDPSFQSKLLHELQMMDDELDKTLRSRSMRASSSNDLRAMANLTPSKRSLANSDGRRDSNGNGNRISDRQVSALKQHVQILELQVATSERVRRHLENSVKEMSAELENGDGSKLSFQSYKAKLAKENKRLAELLAEEAEARRAAEAAQVDGIQAMWNKFQATIDQERQNFSRLEETRKAQLVQQRTTQTELEELRSQLREITVSKKAIQNDLNTLQEQLEEARAEAAGAKRQLQKRLQDEELNSSVSSAANSELLAVVTSYQSKEQVYQEKLEAAEIARAKAARAEQVARRSLAELEKTHTDALSERKGGDDRLKSAQKKAQDLQAKLQEESHENSELAILNKRLTDELADHNNQHQKDLEDLEFTNDQTRKKYQSELAQLSEELQGQRDMLSRLREDNRKLRQDYEELHLSYDDDMMKYNSGGWKKEKDRLETKIVDLTKAYESSSAAQQEQQSQIVALHSQVRELRGVLDDAEADRALLQKARRALQAELEGINNADTSKLSTEREVQRLQLKKQDLERSLEEQEDRFSNAIDRVKKAESYANECQVELGKVRVDNSELDRLNATLEKQIKELKLRIVDLETKSYASSPRATLGRRTDSRIEEISNQLQQSDASRIQRSADKIARDAKFQLAESDRQRAKLEEERKVYQNEIGDLRKAMDELQTTETSLQSAKRKAEREAADYKAKTLSLQQELERLRSRIERPGNMSNFGTPTSSPRK